MICAEHAISEYAFAKKKCGYETRGMCAKYVCSTHFPLQNGIAAIIAKTIAGMIAEMIAKTITKMIMGRITGNVEENMRNDRWG